MRYYVYIEMFLRKINFQKYKKEKVNKSKMKNKQNQSKLIREIIKQKKINIFSIKSTNKNVQQQKQP